MLELFTMPSTTDLFASVGTWSGAFFTLLLPMIGIIAGLLIAGLFINKITQVVISGVKKITGGGKGRRGRRR